MATTKNPTALELWKAVAELQIQWIGMLGQYKLDAARSELVAAVASGQWAVARIKATVAQELEASLRRLRRGRRRFEQRAERISRHARELVRLRDGQRVSSSGLSRAWAAYTVFERLVSTDALRRLTDQPIDPPARRGTSYVDVATGQRPVAGPPDAVDNVLSLMHWMRRRRLIPRVGTRAYRHMIDVLQTMAAVADQQLNWLRESIRAMEDGTWNAWQPVALAALPDSVDIDRVIKLGTR